MKTDYRQLPHLPGVYLFKDSSGHIIYIGKAKSLKTRVGSYFHKDTDWKVKALLEEAEVIDHIITHTETEALLLEAQLVQEYQPKFNVLLKSGQPFVYLLITQAKTPELLVVRNKQKKGSYFGPFIHKQQARAVHRFLVETFQLLRCNKSIKNGCLDFHLGRCAGSCMQQFDPQDYTFRMLLAHDLLKRDHVAFLKKLNEKIAEHAHALEFEKARNLQRYRESVDTLFATIATNYSHEKYAKEAAAAAISAELFNNYEETAQELKTVLGLSGLPETIDCFDISHFQSRSIVGSCVRFTRGKPDKKKFRRFKIRSLKEQNDYAALREIVTRRYKKNEDLPDLVLIDGGKGQRNAVLDLLPNTPCVSLAKKEELLFSEKTPEGLALSLKTDFGKLLIALRDYTHHFAISYHRLSREKEQYNKRKIPKN